MKDKIIGYINMNITALTSEEEDGLREYIEELEMEKFAGDRMTNWS